MMKLENTKNTLISLPIILLASCMTIPVKEAKEIAEPHQLPLVITKLWVDRPNSAGGVDLHVRFINVSQKTIKYAEFTVVAYNRVGDPVYGEIRRSHTRTLKCTGPIEPDEEPLGFIWGNAWYNHTISSIRLTSPVTITYMDGSIQTITELDRLNAMLTPLRN